MYNYIIKNIKSTLENSTLSNDLKNNFHNFISKIKQDITQLECITHKFNKKFKYHITSFNIENKKNTIQTINNNIENNKYHSTNYLSNYSKKIRLREKYNMMPLTIFFNT